MKSAHQNRLTALALLTEIAHPGAGSIAIEPDVQLLSDLRRLRSQAEKKVRDAGSEAESVRWAKVALALDVCALDCRFHLR